MTAAAAAADLEADAPPTDEAVVTPAAPEVDTTAAVAPPVPVRLLERVSLDLVLLEADDTETLSRSPMMYSDTRLLIK